MSFTRIQSLVGSTATSSFASAIGSGDCVAVLGWLSSYTSGTPTLSVTDNKSNSYPVKATFTGVDHYGQNNAVCVAFLENITNGPQTLTVSQTGATGGAIYFLAEEWSGAASSSAADGAACQFFYTSGTNSMTSGNFTPAANGDLIPKVIASDRREPSRAFRWM